MMKAGWTNLILLAVLAAEIALILVLAPDYSRPNLKLLPDMAHQPRFSAFAADPYFPDHQTLREPVAGTIPRGLPPSGSRHPLTTPCARAGSSLTRSGPMTTKRWPAARSSTAASAFPATARRARGTDRWLNAVIRRRSRSPARRRSRFRTDRCFIS